MPSYALVVANAIQSEGPLPLSARRLDTQQWVMGLASASTELREACGYREVVDTARPADTTTQIQVRSLTLQSNVPTVTWTPRNKTQAELDADTQITNTGTLNGKIQAAITANTTALSNVATARAALTTNVITPTPGNVAACNTHIDFVATSLQATMDRVAEALRQLTAIEKLILGNGSLMDTTGT